MKMIPVEEETVKRNYGNLRALFEEFLAMDEKAILLEGVMRNYKNELVATSCLQHAAKKHGYPVKVVRNGTNIYLINLTK